MNFKYYDVLSHLVPGYIIYQVVVYLYSELPEIDLLPSVAIAYIFGYFINTFGSWLENLYYFTWRGMPSSRILKGKSVSKVKVYEWEKACDLLKSETNKDAPSEKYLFAIAMRYANESGNERVYNFNSLYAFSRTLLTSLLVVFGLLLSNYYMKYEIYLIMIPLILIVWQRCKERGYYYAKEIINTYLNIKSS